MRCALSKVAKSVSTGTNSPLNDFFSLDTIASVFFGLPVIRSLRKTPRMQPLHESAEEPLHRETDVDMKENTANIHPLPVDAEEWLWDEVDQNLDLLFGPDLENQPEYFQTVRIFEELLSDPELLICSFRRRHARKYPNSSVAGLSIDNELLVELLSNGVYFIKDLEKQLNVDKKIVPKQIEKLLKATQKSQME